MHNHLRSGNPRAAVIVVRDSKFSRILLSGQRVGYDSSAACRFSHGILRQCELVRTPQRTSPPRYRGPHESQWTEPEKIIVSFEVIGGGHVRCSHRLRKTVVAGGASIFSMPSSKIGTVLMFQISKCILLSGHKFGDLFVFPISLRELHCVSSRTSSMR